MSELPMVAELDHLRSTLLNVTMKVGFLRTAFRSRALRLFSLFSLWIIVSVILAVNFPLWVLALGPMLYGVPHIFTSIRYFHYTAADPHQRENTGIKRRVFLMLSLITLAVFLYRVTINVNLFQMNVTTFTEWKGGTYLELGALLLTFFLGAAIYRRSLLRILGGLSLLSPLLFAFWREPLWTIGALVLIHNFVAFFYWIVSTRSRAERVAAILSTLILTAATVLTFTGALDRLYFWQPPAGSLEFARLHSADIGRMIAPWSDSTALWTHAVIAYAFGQSCHYFCWLKAIPDQHHYHEIPTSFRQSVRFLSQDFSHWGFHVILAFTIGSALIWVFFQFPLARMIYFAMAAFHGYLEIAGLALVGKLSQRRRFGYDRSAPYSPNAS